MIEFISQFFTGIIDSIYSFTGSYGWAIIVFSFLIKLALYYPTHSQYKSMKEMQKIQPELKEIQKKFKDNPEKLQVEQMALFKKHGVSPFGGCLPLLIQLPILWGIFHAIRKFAAMGKFSSETFLWIGGPLSKLFPNYIAGSLAERDIALVVLYGFSMYLSQKITVAQSPSTDGSQKMMSLVMPIAFTFILWNFPSALILYWLMFNLLSIVQQSIVMKQSDDKSPVQILETKNEDDDEVPDDSSDETDDADGEKKQIRSRSRSRKKKGGK